MPKNIKPMSNRNKITFLCETCISAMLLKSYINQWTLSQFFKLDKLYTNYESTRLLQISKIDFIEYKNLIFPNNTYKNLQAYDAVS